MLTITKGELKHMMDKKERFTLIDVRSQERYIEEHIPGAVNIPLEEIERSGLYNLNREDIIIVYDACSDTNILNLRAVDKLTKLDCRRVYDFEGGMRDWKNSGYRTESSIYSRAVAA
jgi:rhodanese-related sulfurtransferase